jgi:hypothetical protein
MNKFHFVITIALLVGGCNIENEKLKKTPKDLLASGELYYSEGDYENSLKELKILVEYFKETGEAKKAKLLIIDIENSIAEKEELEEKKNLLGFKLLEERRSLIIDNVTMIFKSISIGNEWNFDYSEDDTYHYWKAERDNTYILAKVKVISKIKQTRIPLISVYKLKNGKLYLLGNMKRQFLTELVNVNDKDFKYVSSVNFSQAFEISKKTIDNSPVFLVVKKENLSDYTWGTYCDTESSPANSFKMKKNLILSDFDKDYILVKKYNTKKIESR